MNQQQSTVISSINHSPHAEAQTLERPPPRSGVLPTRLATPIPNLCARKDGLTKLRQALERFWVNNEEKSTDRLDMKAKSKFGLQFKMKKLFYIFFKCLLKNDALDTVSLMETISRISLNLKFMLNSENSVRAG